MASEGWDVGDIARFRSDFTVGQTTAIGSPTAVRFLLRGPSDSAATAYTYAGGTVSLSTDGYFYKDVTLTESGDYWGRFEGTGAIVAAGEISIEVRTQLVTT